MKNKNLIIVILSVIFASLIEYRLGKVIAGVQPDNFMDRFFLGLFATLLLAIFQLTVVVLATSIVAKIWSQLKANIVKGTLALSAVLLFLILLFTGFTAILGETFVIGIFAFILAYAFDECGFIEWLREN